MRHAKLCQICHKEFIPKHNAQQICERDHFAECPVCQKVIVWNSTKPVRTCSRACADVLRKQSMMSRFNVENAMRSAILVDKRKQKRVDRIHKLLPLKMIEKEKSPKFLIEEDSMHIFILREAASKEFLLHYGFQLRCKFRKKHLSVGLVADGILYQVIRFELNQDSVMLSDFGTRGGYFNPRSYTKLFNYVEEYAGIEEFSAYIPRKLATQQLLNCFSLVKISDGDYIPYWIMDGEYVPVSTRDDIETMKLSYDYVTTDWLDFYQHI